MLKPIIYRLASQIPVQTLLFHYDNFLPKQHSLYEWHFFLNRIWYYTNVALIIPVMLACLNRFLNPDLKVKLWTDHLARAFLIFGAVFYIAQCLVKYQTEGTQTICMKGMFIHHFAGIFVLSCLFLNSYIPWWTCPLGFMHGLCIAFPESGILNIIYGASLVVFQIGIYRKPYSQMKYYNVLRYFVNFIWVFAILLYLGDCSNYMQLHPQKDLV